MPSKFLGVMTGVALLASVGVANAGQRAPLTDEQLDKVVAGNAATVSLSGLNVAASGSFIVQASTTTATAAISLDFSNVGTGTPHELSVATTVTVP